MEIELIEVRDFLGANHPFDQLSQEALDRLPEKLQIRYFRRDSQIPDTGTLHNYLYIVRTGAVEIHGEDNELLARLGEGDVFGYRASHLDKQPKAHGTALEDSLLYQLPAKELDALCDKNPQLAYFFEVVGGDRLRDAITMSSSNENSQLTLMATQISDMITRAPVTVPPTATIKETAEIMTEAGVSSILITEGAALTGVVTDRDFRRRVVSKGLDVMQPITSIMTKDPFTIDAHSYAFEAMLFMARSNIHHLPVVNNGQIAGMVTATDITQRHTTSAVYLVGAIYKQTEVSKIKEIADRVPQLLVSLATADATADSVGHVITSVVDAITNRLIQLAEEQLGAPPIPYAWVAAGSQARSEQTAKSDQDNCMILHDSYDPALHGEYFKALAKFVCDGLNECGYIYCPGEMMAVTDQWRQPLKSWKQYFSKWIGQPEPKALMLTCVFFDMRCISTDKQLFDELRAYMLEKTRGNRLFLAYMAGNALTHRPPLGFFRNFVLIHGGEHDHTFDLKHTGIVPIIDLTRVYALAAGCDAVNTLERLEVVSEGGEVSTEGARDLHDALEFVSFLRIEHQSRQIKRGEEADNFMSPDRLSHFERNHLKDAFDVVRTMQNVISQRYSR